MRELKFRAWHKKRKEMRFISQLDFQDNLVDIEGDICAWNIDHCEIMQYTGLKDKNGVEIYESDILKNDLGTMPFSEVIYSDESAQFSHSGFSWPTGMIEHENCTVIGNTYQNPELLEDNE